MKRTLRHYALCAGTIIFLASQSAAQDSVKLRLNLAAGKTYKFASTTSTKSNMGAQDMSMTMSQIQVVKVKSKSASSYKMSFSSENVKVTVPPSSPMKNMVKTLEDGMKKAAYDAEYDLQGKAKGGGPAASAGGMMSQMTGGMGNMGVGFLGTEFPAGPVKVGTSWTSEMDIAKMMSGAGSGVSASGKPISVKFTVTKITKSGTKTLVTMSVAMNGTTTMNMGGAAQGAKGAQMSAKMTMSGTGSSTVDAATGLPTSTSMKMDNTVMFGQMQVKQTITSTLTQK